MITRRTPLKSRWKPAVPAEVRELLIARSGGWCEAQIPTICTGGATDSAHRITRKAGGRHGEAKAGHDRLANLLDLCHACHRWTHDNPNSAKDLGLALSETDDPRLCPVAYRGAIAYLADDGAILTSPAGVA